MKNVIKYLVTFSWMTKTFWLRFFLSIIAITWILKLVDKNTHVSDTLALGGMGFVGGLIALKEAGKYVQKIDVKKLSDSLAEKLSQRITK